MTNRLLAMRQPRPHGEREMGRFATAWGSLWEAVTLPIPSPDTLKNIYSVPGTVPISKAT